MLRSLVERLTRHLVFQRRLSSEFGAAALYVSPAAGLKFLGKPLAHADPPLLGLARDYVHPGDVVWDIGANVGLFAFAAAARAGPSAKVFALEADDWLIRLLRKSAALPAAARAPVVPIAVAVAEHCGLREFQLAVRSRATSALAGYGHSTSGGFRESRTVVAVSLDWLMDFLPPPAFVKDRCRRGRAGSAARREPADRALSPAHRLRSPRRHPRDGRRLLCRPRLLSGRRRGTSLLPYATNPAGVEHRRSACLNPRGSARAPIQLSEFVTVLASAHNRPQIRG